MLQPTCGYSGATTHLWVLVPRFNTAEHGEDKGSCLASTRLRLCNQVLRAAATHSRVQHQRELRKTSHPTTLGESSAG